MRMILWGGGDPMGLGMTLWGWESNLWGWG